MKFKCTSAQFCNFPFFSSPPSHRIIACSTLLFQRQSPEQRVTDSLFLSPPPSSLPPFFGCFQAAAAPAPTSNSLLSAVACSSFYQDDPTPLCLFIPFPLQFGLFCITILFLETATTTFPLFLKNLHVILVLIKTLKGFQRHVRKTVAPSVLAQIVIKQLLKYKIFTLYHSEEP